MKSALVPASAGLHRALVASGYARAKEVTRRHAKSFFFASNVLFGARRRAAFALYSFCRRLDDLVDGDNPGDGSVAQPQATAAELQARLDLARASLGAVWSSSVGAPLVRELPWADDELAAFRDTVERYRIPEQPFQELINGMEMDLSKTRYANFDELSLYCYRVAGVVGLMLTHVLGYDDEACLPYAVDLGVAMQLTNIIRDVKEDWQRGRVYLPQDELARFGLDESDLERFCAPAARASPAWPRWCEFLKFQIARAREIDARSHLGVPHLTGLGSGRVVRVMSAVYGGILGEVERQQYDVFSRRARVSLGGKLALAFKACVWSPSRLSLPAQLPRGTA